MGFFSKILDPHPNRTVAYEIRDRCSSTVLSAKEENLVFKFGVDREHFTWLRNSYNYSVYQAFLSAMERRYPDTYFSITRSFLNGIIHDVFYSKERIVRLEEIGVMPPSIYGSGLWDDCFGEFCENLEDKNNITLSPSDREEIEGLTSEYQDEISYFIKKRLSKLRGSI